MPPKNSIRLDAGTLYFNTTEGPVPFCTGVQEASLEIEEPELDIFADDKARIITAPPQEFTSSIRLTDEGTEMMRRMIEGLKLLALAKTMLYCYPSRRVGHLAIHHGKERVRKKNLKRIVRYYKKR